MANKTENNNPEFEAAVLERTQKFFNRPFSQIAEELNALTDAGNGMVIINPATRTAVRVGRVKPYAPKDNESHYKNFFTEVKGKPVDHTIPNGHIVALGFWRFPQSSTLALISAQGEEGEEGAIVEIAEANGVQTSQDALGRTQYIDLEKLPNKTAITQQLGMAKYDPKTQAPEERPMYGLQFVDTTGNVMRLIDTSATMQNVQGIPHDPSEQYSGDSSSYLEQFVDPNGGQ